MPGGRHVAGQSRVHMVKAGSHFASAPAASSATPNPKAAADAFEPAWTPRPVGSRFATSPKAEQPSASQVAAQIAPKPVTLPARPSASASNPSAWETAEFMRIAASRGTSGAPSAGAPKASSLGYACHAANRFACGGCGYGIPRCASNRSARDGGCPFGSHLLAGSAGKVLGIRSCSDSGF